MVEFTAESYIAGVLDGRVPACKWVRLACERHRRDLETGHERGLYFDENAAKLVIAFFSLLRHSKGEWAGQVIILEPWQQAHLWILFGWKRADGTRRFRSSYLEVARKNGKSTLAAGIGLYLLIADGEPGAEIYTGATKLDQARIIHSEAVRMVQQSGDLLNEVELYKDNINNPTTFSKYEPLASDSKSLDGLNAHAGLIDEVHAHPSRDLWDVIRFSQGSRRQPLMYAITTAGFDRESFCFEEHEYTEKILEGVIEDDSHYGIIYTLDEADNWENEITWIKANPNLGISKKPERLRDEAREAKEKPSAINNFLRFQFDIWTQAATRWVNFEKWKACGGVIDEGRLIGRLAHAGLDLSSKLDITALVYVFPPSLPEDRYDILCRFFVPQERIEERVRGGRAPYDLWLSQGFLTATPGNVVDYDFIIARIEADAKLFHIGNIGFDPWNASGTSTRLANKGFRMVEMRQGYATLSEPMKELERLIISEKLNHGNNPVLTWMAHNLVSRMDPAGNIKPDKEKSLEKIDGMAALVMAIDWAAVRVPRPAGSVYDERGLRTL